jgi:hypothetical protein
MRLFGVGRNLFIGALVFLIVPGQVPAEDFVPPGERSERAIGGGRLSFWPERPWQAEVLTATFIGGKGHEWLVGGGFQPDGTVVVAGNVAGGVFDLGVRATVIGRDGSPPAEPKLGADQRGRPELPSWKLDGVTGFIARLSPDLKRIVNVTRMPWNSGAITSIVVDDRGNLYVAGKATDTITSLGGQHQKLPVSPDAERRGGGCNHTFLARLSPDGARCEWLRTFEGLSDAPTVALRADGNLSFAAQDVRSFDLGGRQLAVSVIPGGVRETSSVNPVDATIVRGGERHWGTGREPWRCPILNIHNPDGSLRYELYQWPGPYVGLDNLRLVSDSAVRLVTHDKQGNILFVAWSDGGNSVMTQLPADVRSGVGLRGTGLTSAGAGVTSFAYLVKLDPKTYEVIGWTFWCSRYAGRANGIGVRALGQADDGSFCIAGGSAWGLVQTRNFIGRSEPGGEYIAVLTPDMSGVRFSSAIPGAGAAVVGNDRGDSWGIGSGTVNGQPRVLFVAGATGEANVYGHKSQTPTVNALQETFGGGWSDGYLVVLDLSRGADQLPQALASREARPRRLTIQAAAQRVGGRSRAAEPPPDGHVSYLSAAWPRHVTVDAEFRDVNGRMWPSFLFGRPVDGSVTYSAEGSQGAFSVQANNWCQPRGLQDRRVLGELITDARSLPALTFTVHRFGRPQTETFQETDSQGRTFEKQVTWQEADATLELGATKLDVRPKCVFSWRTTGRDRAPVGVRITAYLTVQGRELGLKKLANEEIDIRITMQGYEQREAPPRRR